MCGTSVYICGTSVYICSVCVFTRVTHAALCACNTPSKIELSCSYLKQNRLSAIVAAETGGGGGAPAALAIGANMECRLMESALVLTLRCRPQRLSVCGLRSILQQGGW